MSELSFLIDLLMNHKLSKPTKELIAARIKEVESLMTMTHAYLPANAKISTYLGPPQAASTLALLEKHGPLPIPEIPVEQIAQTPATAAAMNDRAATMAGIKKHDPNTGRPRKF